MPMNQEDDRDNQAQTESVRATSAIWPSLGPNVRVALYSWGIMVCTIIALSLWPKGVISDHHHLDKIGHFAAYGALAFLPSLFARSIRQTALILLTIGAIGIGLEAAQALLPERIPSYLDLAANLAGVLAGTAAGFFARPYLKQFLQNIGY